MTSCAIDGVILTLRVKHSLASDSLPSRSSCLPFCRFACRRLLMKYTLNILNLKLYIFSSLIDLGVYTIHTSQNMHISKRTYMIIRYTYRHSRVWLEERENKREKKGQHFKKILNTGHQSSNLLLYPHLANNMHACIHVSISFINEL